MNLLAYVVYSLMTGIGKEQLTQHLAQLSPLERSVLAELQPLLQRAPQDLAAVLAQLGPINDWDKLPL
ncbi:MAG: hypothetical protein DPW09_02880 [Anaerolineae bacterium]|jgi:hypothetical protein|nr:hypothetical protein [Anaerolineae bacterium]